MRLKEIIAIAFVFIISTFAVASEKLESQKSIFACKLDCAYSQIRFNNLTLFGFEDQKPLKESYELINDEIRKQFKTHHDGNAFEIKLKNRLKDQVLRNAGITERNKIFIEIIEPKLKKMSLTNKEIKSLKAGVNLFDTSAVPGKTKYEPALDTIDIMPVNGDGAEESHGIAYIGEKDPGFKNFGRIKFAETSNIFTTSEIKSELDKSIYTNGLNLTLGKVSTMKFEKNNLVIYKVVVSADAKIGKKSQEKREIEAYFLKTPAGLFGLVPFDASFRSYYNPIRYIYYGETGSAKIVSLDTYNAFEASQIIKVGDSDMPEVISSKMGFVD